MSFILEALKKSEQQRQKQNTSTQGVRNRTLSLSTMPSGRRSYWLLVVILPLVLLCGWWFYSGTGTTVEKTTEPSRTGSTPVTNQPRQPETVTAPIASLASNQQPAVVGAESAPVPSIYALAPEVPAGPTSNENNAPVVQSRQVDVGTTSKILREDEQVRFERIEQSKPHVNSRIPLYFDLSREMRERMPRLAMSMHFYNSDPDRRLVRINDRLLHEGDPVTRELELVEISPTGVILDFQGQIFELPGARPQK